MSGIHTIDDLRARCWVDEQTGCWHWRMCTNGQGVPSLWLPAAGASVSLPTAVCVLVTGKKPQRGEIWHCTCETRACANPAHRTPGTRSSQMLACRLTRSPLQRARMASAKHAKSRLSPADVEQIFASTALLRDIAAQYGISPSHASRIRRGERRSVSASAGASVFSWRPA